MSDERDYSPYGSYITFHSGDTVTVQRDLENGCIDIEISGSNSFRTTKITVFPHYSRVDDGPALVMLDDVVKKEAPVDETAA